MITKENRVIDAEQQKRLEEKTMTIADIGLDSLLENFVFEMTEDYNNMEESMDSKICLNSNNLIFWILADSRDFLKEIQIFFANSCKGGNRSEYWLNLIVVESVYEKSCVNYVIQKDIRELSKKYGVDCRGTLNEEVEMFFNEVFEKEKDLTFKDLYNELMSEQELKTIIA